MCIVHPPAVLQTEEKLADYKDFIIISNFLSRSCQSDLHLHSHICPSSNQEISRGDKMRGDYFCVWCYECSNFILLHLVVQFSQHHFLKLLSFLHCIFLTPWQRLGAWVYLWAFYPVLLIHVFVFVPVPNCLDHCSIVWSQKAWFLQLFFFFISHKKEWKWVICRYMESLSHRVKSEREKHMSYINTAIGI